MRHKWIVALFILISSPAHAATDWPTRPVTIVLPFPAGGAVDSATRAIAEELGSRLGQRFIVENRPGANGTIGPAAVARAAPDGYTLLMATLGLVTSKFLYQPLPYDPQTAFVPIVLVGNTPLIIVGSKKLPVSDFKSLIAYATANPDKISAGTTGIGSIGHIVLGLLKKREGASITNVPYRDYPKMIPDLFSGDPHLGMIFMPFFVPQVLDGKLLGLAVASRQRSDALPAVPSVAELGYSDFISDGWAALMAPTGTPPDIIEKINIVTNNYLKSESGRALMRNLSMTPGSGTPKSLSDYVSSEYLRWGPVIKESSVPLQ